jgi:hypothetical protein
MKRISKYDVKEGDIIKAWYGSHWWMFRVIRFFNKDKSIAEVKYLKSKLTANKNSDSIGRFRIHTYRLKVYKIEEKDAITLIL